MRVSWTDPCVVSSTPRLVAADAKLTQGRPLKIDLPRRGILPSGGPHVGGGGSGGDPGLETAGGNCEVERVEFEL
jgi:hypothetical protein